MAKPPQDEQPGGFFARARELARRAADEPVAPPPRTHVLRCPGCGAPRHQIDLVCRFCGGRTTE